MRAALNFRRQVGILITLVLTGAVLGDALVLGVTTVIGGLPVHPTNPTVLPMLANMIAITAWGALAGLIVAAFFIVAAAACFDRQVGAVEAVGRAATRGWWLMLPGLVAGGIAAISTLPLASYCEQAQRVNTGMEQASMSPALITLLLLIGLAAAAVAVKLSMLAPVAIVEGRRGQEAMARALRLIHGHEWQLAIMWALTAGVAGVVLVVAQSLLTIWLAAPLAGPCLAIGRGLFMALAVAEAACLYFEIAVREEGVLVPEVVVDLPYAFEEAEGVALVEPEAEPVAPPIEPAEVVRVAPPVKRVEVVRVAAPPEPTAAKAGAPSVAPAEAERAPGGPEQATPVAAPVTQVVEPPVVEPPPVAEPPNVALPIAEMPIAEMPVAEMPVAELPVAEPSVAELPVAEPPVAAPPLPPPVSETGAPLATDGRIPVAEEPPAPPDRAAETGVSLPEPASATTSPSVEAPAPPQTQPGQISESISPAWAGSPLPARDALVATGWIPAAAPSASEWRAVVHAAEAFLSQAAAPRE